MVPVSGLKHNFRELVEGIQGRKYKYRGLQIRMLLVRSFPIVALPRASFELASAAVAHLPRAEYNVTLKTKHCPPFSPPPPDLYLRSSAFSYFPQRLHESPGRLPSSAYQAMMIDRLSQGASGPSSPISQTLKLSFAAQVRFDCFQPTCTRSSHSC